MSPDHESGILVVSLAVSAGWLTNEDSLAESLDRLGAPYRIERARIGWSGRLRRTLLGVDVVEALACRGALDRGLAGGRPAAVILMSSTSALLAPVERLRRRGIRVAVRLDCPATVNRPGWSGAAQRRIEPRRLRAADLVMAMGPRSAETVQAMARRVAIVPAGIDAGEPSGGARSATPEVIAYAADPRKKRLEAMAAAWTELGERRGSARLVVCGIEPEPARRHLGEHGVPLPPATEIAGLLPRRDYLRRLAGARAFLSTSRLEEHGIAQLEALALGVPLVTAPAAGAYEAEPLARELDPGLLAPSHTPAALAAALERALAMDERARTSYAERARQAVRPFGPEAADRALGEALEVLLPARGGS